MATQLPNGAASAVGEIGPVARRLACIMESSLLPCEIIIILIN